MGVSKFIYDGEVKFDLTSDTVEASKLLKGITAHGADGEAITGTCEFDVKSSACTATAAEVLTGKTFAKGGSVLTGSMKNNGAVSGTITTKAGAYTIPQGYHDGSGKVQIDSTEQSKIIATNIRQGVTILGITGSMSDTEGAKAQSKTVAPKTTAQTVVPDSGYNYLSQVTVSAIPYGESTNAAGGTTVTIG